MRYSRLKICILSTLSIGYTQWYICIPPSQVKVTAALPPDAVRIFCCSFLCGLYVDNPIVYPFGTLERVERGGWRGEKGRKLFVLTNEKWAASQMLQKKPTFNRKHSCILTFRPFLFLLFIRAGQVLLAEILPWNTAYPSIMPESMTLESTPVTRPFSKRTLSTSW